MNEASDTAGRHGVHRRSEHWEADAGDASVAHLDIPADAVRDRAFEVAVDWSVRALPGVAEAWHELRVLLNGAHQWTRRVPTHLDGGDGLDYRVRCEVPAGQALRVAAVTHSTGVRRLSLRITADED